MSDLKKFAKDFRHLKKSEKEDDDEVEMPKKEFVKEHKRLVRVLESKSHKDDKKEAKKQKKELKEYTKKSQFIKEFKKSYDYRDLSVSIDAKDQHAAETTAIPELVNYIRAATEGDLSKIPFEKGTLTLSKKDEGLFSGHFEDEHGQVVEKFDDQTVEMVAKNMQIKNLYVKSEPKKTQSVQGGGYVKFKYGDFEFEMRKALVDFTKKFKKSTDNTQAIKKAVRAWIRNNPNKYNTELEAAEDLLKNWQEHEEGFCQTVHAMKQLEDDDK